MKGYLKNAEATREAFSGGWFHSGDLAVMQPDGYVKIKDRSKDVIISGGENISSLEVEDVLYRHPAVLAAAVVAMPDEKWGETPCAFVETRPDAQLTDKEIIEFCRRHLASFKAPRAVVFGELPKTSTGKIQKFVLRDKAKSATAIQTWCCWPAWQSTSHSREKALAQCFSPRHCERQSPPGRSPQSVSSWWTPSMKTRPPSTSDTVSSEHPSIRCDSTDV